MLPALIQGVNIYNALKDVCKAEAHLDLEIGSETQYTFWRHAVVELAVSLTKRLIDHADKRISDGLTKLEKAKARLINRRPPQQEWVQLTRGLLHTVAFFCKLLMATSFNKQLKWCAGLSDEGV